MIFTYNKEHVGDVLMVIVKDSKGAKLDYERKGNVSRVFLEKNGETVAWNIFEVSSLVTIEGVGQVTLSDQDVATLNAELTKEGFSEQLENEPSPKFVVGQIVQIVAGAPNAAVGLKTIVALPGAMMPNGSLIFPGALRGEKSFGMMCSPRELALPNAPQKRGIIELDDTALVGEAFNPEKHWKG